MVIVILKDGYTFGFEMVSFDKEQAIVEKFMSGKLSPSTVLDLKSKGSYKVEEIQALEFTPTKVLKKEKSDAEKAEEDAKRKKEDLWNDLVKKQRKKR